ncbi:MAG: hypothetical protein ACT4OS_07935 [Acidimicrobiales bacterium]
MTDRTSVPGPAPFSHRLPWQEFVDGASASLSRRQLLTLAASLLPGWALAGCSGGGPARPDPGRGSPSTLAPVTDAVVLRTVSSLHWLAADIYNRAVASGLLSEEARDLARHMGERSRGAAQRMDDATRPIGPNLAFGSPNPEVAARLAEPLAAARTEKDLFDLAYEAESITLATAVFAVGSMGDRRLNPALLAGAGASARHLAVLGTIIGLPARPPVPPDGFITNRDAVPVGSGV